MWCPGGTENDGRGTLVVTGAAAATPSSNADVAAERAAAVDQYRNYLIEQSNQLVTTTTTLTRTRIEAGDLAAATARCRAGSGSPRVHPRDPRCKHVRSPIQIAELAQEGTPLNRVHRAQLERDLRGAARRRAGRLHR